MGHGIAQVFAGAGHEVRITDPSAEVRARVRDRIGANLDDLGADRRRARAHRRGGDARGLRRRRADVVIEAAPEDLALKQRIFADIERAAPPSAILASNTSVIPISQIMANVCATRRARSARTGGIRPIWCRWSK